MEADMTGRRNPALRALALGAALLLAATAGGLAEEASGASSGGASGASASDPGRQLVVEPAGASASETDAAPPADAAAAETAAPAEDAAPPETAPAENAAAPVETAAPAEPPAAVIVVEPTPAAQADVDIPVPTDPVAKAAFNALDRNCARCHQSGAKLTARKKPAKNFGNVLILDELAANPHYIIPGNPEASKIVQAIRNSEMPYDIFYDFDMAHAPAPTPEEVAALSAWITQLGETKAAACESRKFITPTDMASAMAADIEALPKTRVADTRYVTLTHLYNACAADGDMEVFRQATVKLLNSLSRVSDVVKLETVDDAGTIVRFNLKDVGWEPEDWNKVLAVYPYAARPDSKMFDLLSAATVTPLPYVRGDWLAFTASQPPLYDVLLNLADDFFGLEKQLGVDTLKGIKDFTAKRAAFQHSGVSQNNRLIERHTIPTGYFWTSYDFAGNRANQSLFQFPLGPDSGDDSFHHDGGESIFSLPNGFQGYYLNKANGERLDKGPTQIVRDLSRRDLTVTNGISCMGCHEFGIRKAKDEVRAHVLADRTFPKSVRDAVEALYPTNEEMDAILSSDLQVFLDAMTRAGLGVKGPDGKVLRDENGNPRFPNLNGVEMINALAKRYEDDVEQRLAAAEYGQTADEFAASIAGAGDPDATRIGRRLDQGTVPRDTFEKLYGQIVDNVSDLEMIDLADLAGAGVGTATVARPVTDSRTFDLSLVSDRSNYKVGDQVTFTVTSAEDCFLTLINVDQKGKATVLFPNKFEKNNAIKAKADLNFPSEKDGFQFSFADPGTETVIAVCSLTDKPVDDIKFDFTREFTELGDYDKVLTRAIVVHAKEAEAGAKGKTASADAGKAKAGSGDIVARAAIKMKVAP
jgi:hypothetical protein